MTNKQKPCSWQANVLLLDADGFHDTPRRTWRISCNMGLFNQLGLASTLDKVLLHYPAPIGDLKLHKCLSCWNHVFLTAKMYKWLNGIISCAGWKSSDLNPPIKFSAVLCFTFFHHWPPLHCNWTWPRNCFCRSSRIRPSCRQWQFWTEAKRLRIHVWILLCVCVYLYACAK